VNPGRPRFPLALDRVVVAGRRTEGGDLIRPQRLLREAAQDAARSSPPTGIGLDSSAVRGRMVDRLRAGGIRHEAVLAAMAAVPRHVFVDSALAPQAYEDTSLPIGLGQTISKPSVVARMLELLFEGRHARDSGDLGRVLEIGGGCGYQTALLALLAREVVSIERLRELHDRARTRLDAVLADLAPLTVPIAAGNNGRPPVRPVARVRLIHGDGRAGLAAAGPFHSLLSAAGGEKLPQAWLDQLAIGGRLIAPTDAADGRGQVLVVVDRDADGYRRSESGAVHFVPLKSGVD
jgi:protein-L-isoaspartate(D-aspartate) O-methyltransferase